MTSNKRFKRRVRQRAEKTGESYTSALRRTRRYDENADQRQEALQVYLTEVREIPPLTPDRERSLLTEARRGDTEAMNAVIEAILARAADLAIELAPGAGLDDLDAVCEANLVLMRLVQDSDGPDGPDDAATVSERLDGAIRAKLSTP